MLYAEAGAVSLSFLFPYDDHGPWAFSFLRFAEKVCETYTLPSSNYL